MFQERLHTLFFSEKWLITLTRAHCGAESGAMFRSASSGTSRIYNLILSIILVAGFCAVSFAVFGLAEDKSLEDCHERFALLNARRRCEADEPPKKQEYELLMDALAWRVEEWEKNGQATHVSVYFRDLENGPLFGIQEQEHFAPASLLKVPIMIALLKYAELHPEILNEEISAEQDQNVVPNVFEQGKTIVLHQKYPVHEVLRRMIVYSDNAAKELLHSYLEEISPGILDQTFIDLGILLQDEDGDQFITVKSYASLIRSLYNASYVNRELSQRGLELLSEVEFSDGIRAGVPKSTVVANKFGYLELSPEERQLHDCGVVYHPNAPYLLCVMTRGGDQESILAIITAISREVYEEVSLRDPDGGRKNET